MRVLIATLYLPYPQVPHGGGRDLMHWIRFLNRRHEVCVVSFVDEAQAAHAAELRPHVADLCLVRPALTWQQKVSRGLRALRQGRWHSLGRRADAEVRAYLQNTRADVLYCAWTHMGRYLPVAAPGTVRVLDEVDVRFVVEEAAAPENDRQQRLLQRRRQEEITYCRQADLVVTRSQRDLQRLRGFLPGLTGAVLPPVGHVGQLSTIPPGAGRPDRVLFVGAMDRARNQIAARWLVEEIWPRVRAQCPEATLRIVGAAPPPTIQALERYPGVTVTGWVDDLPAEYTQAHLVVAPMRSEAGALNKVIDGLAAGRAVVATPLANAGVCAPPEAITLADTTTAFAGAVVRLMVDDRARARQAAAARRFALRSFDWPGAAMALERRLLALADHRCK